MTAERSRAWPGIGSPLEHVRRHPAAGDTITAMPDSIFLIGHDGDVTEAGITTYSLEAELQKLLAALQS
jgi:hypothetical protein